MPRARRLVIHDTPEGRALIDTLARVQAEQQRDRAAASSPPRERDARAHALRAS